MSRIHKRAFNLSMICDETEVTIGDVIYTLDDGKNPEQWGEVTEIIHRHYYDCDGVESIDCVPVWLLHNGLWWGPHGLHDSVNKAVGWKEEYEWRYFVNQYGVYWKINKCYKWDHETISGSHHMFKTEAEMRLFIKRYYGLEEDEIDPLVVDKYEVINGGHIFNEDLTVSQKHSMAQWVSNYMV